MERVLPRAFVWRRLHSLLGLWIVLFLIEHLFTNSQAALLIGDDGNGFVRAVNFLKSLPYLPVIEIVLLGVPILFHIIWGVRILMTSKMNSFPSNGSKPALTEYGRNHAYSWQRITSWILLVGIVLHVGYMRFYRYPDSVKQGLKTIYFVRLHDDPGLPTVADRLGANLFLASEIEEKQKEFKRFDIPSKTDALKYQTYKETRKWVNTLSKQSLTSNELIATTESFGVAELLIVRDSFSSIFKSILYTFFVLAAAFHAFNGLWTFMITWGVILSIRSQKSMVNVCYSIMLLIAFLGLAAVWGTYWMNLRS